VICVYEIPIVCFFCFTGTNLLEFDGGVPNGDPGLLFSLLASTVQEIKKTMHLVICDCESTICFFFTPHQQSHETNVIDLAKPKSRAPDYNKLT